MRWIMYRFEPPATGEGEGADPPGVKRADLV